MSSQILDPEVERVSRWLRQTRDDAPDESPIASVVLSHRGSREERVAERPFTYETNVGDTARDFLSRAHDHAAGLPGAQQYVLNAYTEKLGRPVSNCPIRISPEHTPTAIEGDPANPQVILRQQAAHIEALMRINLATMTAAQSTLIQSVKEANKRAADADEAWHTAREAHMRMQEAEARHEIDAIKAANVEEMKKRGFDRVLMLAQYAGTSMLGAKGLLNGPSEEAMMGVAIVDMLKQLPPETLLKWMSDMTPEQQATVGTLVGKLVERGAMAPKPAKPDVSGGNWRRKHGTQSD